MLKALQIIVTLKWGLIPEITHRTESIKKKKHLKNFQHSNSEFKSLSTLRFGSHLASIKTRKLLTRLCGAFHGFRSITREEGLLVTTAANKGQWGSTRVALIRIVNFIDESSSFFFLFYRGKWFFFRLFARLKGKVLQGMSSEEFSVFRMWV